METGRDKRSKIVEAAIAEFLEHGFGDATMDRVAARAQVSKRTVYSHFEGKERLFRAIVDMMVETVRDTLEIRFDPARPAEAQLRALIAAEGRLMCAPDFFRLARIAIGRAMRDPGLKADLDTRLDKTAAVERFLAEADGAGHLRVPDPGRAARELLATLKGQAFWPKIIAGEPVTRAEMDAIEESAAALFLARYGR